MHLSSPSPPLSVSDLVVDLDTHDITEVGGKAHMLSRLRELGAPVPDGIVVTNRAFQAFLDASPLRTRIARLSRVLEHGDRVRSKECAATIHEWVIRAPIPAEIWSALVTARRVRLPDVLVAVRSSAVGEDSAAASFAGQLSSVLAVDTDEALWRALKTCWASYWSETALAYQHSRRIALGGMGVIVQRMVPARLAGVLFTRAPRRGSAAGESEEEMIAEYGFGLGEALVAGAMNPGRFAIDRRTGAVRRLCGPEQPAADAGFADSEAAFFAAEGGAARLARLATHIERQLGSPQDIEWAVDGTGELYIVQARPITTPVATTTPPAPQRKLVVWSNANVNENFPGPISPFLHSIASLGYYHYFRNLALAFGVSPERVRRLEHPLRHIIGVHAARMYYNLSNIHAVLRMAPFGGRLVEFFNVFVGADEKPAALAEEGSWRALARARIRSALEIARVGASVVREYHRLDRGVARFERTVDEFCDRCDAHLAESATLPELAHLLRDFLDIRCHRWLDAARADAASMIGYGLVKALLGPTPSGEQKSALHHDLLSGLGALVSSAPAIELWKLSRLIRADPALVRLFTEGRSNDDILRALTTTPKHAPFHEELHRFLREWGFRCPGELLLTVPSFEESPAALVDLLRSYARMDGQPPHEIIRTQEAARAQRTEQILRALARHPLVAGLPLPTRAQALAAALSLTQRAIALRERARLKQSRLYSRCRRIALALGDRLVESGRIAARDDVFFFRIEELDALASGDALFAHHLEDELAQRKRRHAELAALEPPDTIVLPEGECWPPEGLSRPSVSAPATAKVDPADTVLRGTSACGGHVVARAAVLDDVSQADRLQPGDILVTRQTDPAWGPVFFMVRGLVIERGGMLSHGAIIAREFGIPAVVGVRDATRRIPQGARLAVDGDQGVVSIVG